MKTHAIFTVALLLVASATHAQVTKEHQTATKLPKESSRVDYFSFVGRDASGLVGFAIDNTRAKNGDTYYAQLYTAFYADGAGWMKVRGSGHIKNTQKVVAPIVSSPLIKFGGSRKTGIRIVSTANGFELKSGPYPKIIERQHNGESYRMSASPATFRWKGRTINGRMIHEQLIAPRRDMDAIPAAQKWKNYNGFYLKTPDNHDFYFHHDDSPGSHKLSGRQIGFATWDKPEKITPLGFKVTKSDAGPTANYRWHKSWTIRFRYNKTNYTLPLTTSSFLPVSNWKTGGFAMAIVSGTATSEDGTRKIKLEGFGELLP